jgi:hypothetical protein
LKYLVVALGLSLACVAQAQTPSIEIKEDGIKNESEVTLVDAKGNSVSNAFGAKQQNAYKWDDNVVKGQARYFSSTAGGVESSRNWDLGSRVSNDVITQTSVRATRCRRMLSSDGSSKPVTASRSSITMIKAFAHRTSVDSIPKRFTR